MSQEAALHEDEHRGAASRDGALRDDAARSDSSHARARRDGALGDDAARSDSSHARARPEGALRDDAARSDSSHARARPDAAPPDAPHEDASADAPVPAASLDRVIHERMRLAILSALAGRSEVSFSELKALTGATDGNLSVHARRLEEVGYVSCTKAFAGRVPRTAYRITEAGRRALLAYLDHLEALIQQVRES